MTNNIFNPDRNIKKIIIHSGVFHADDVLCVALLKEFVNNDIEVIRNNIPDTSGIPEDTIIADVGGKFDNDRFFDHHQLDGQNDATTAVCSAELLWKRFGNPDCHEISRYLHEVSLHDTGCRLSEVGWIFKDLQPTWNSGESIDNAFEKAVKLGRSILGRKAELFEARVNAKNLYDTAERIGNTIIIEKFFPWQDYAAKDPTVNRAIMPGRDEGTYNLQVKIGRTLPEEWLTNPPIGCTFVHPGRFMAVFSSFEAAVNAANGLYNPNK